jgi:hypothetical protein
VPDEHSQWQAALDRHLEAGGSVLCYGPTTHAGAAWRRRLGLALADPVEGEFPIVVSNALDRYARPAPQTAVHRAAVSAGGMAEISATTEGNHVLACVGDRVAAAARDRLAWVRGSSSVTVKGVKGRNLAIHDPERYAIAEHLFRRALAALGWEISLDRATARADAAHLMMHRCRNGFVFTGFSPESDLVYRLRTPLGAPLLPGRDMRLEDGRSCLPAWHWFHEECRVFVEQPCGELGLHAVSPKHYRYSRRWLLTGLQNATVRFFPESGCFDTTDVLLNPNPHYWTTGDDYAGEWITDRFGRYLEMRHITGSVTFAWGPDDRPVPVLPEEAGWDTPQ